jgi:hypothetical protein
VTSIGKDRIRYYPEAMSGELYEDLAEAKR